MLKIKAFPLLEGVLQLTERKPECFCYNYAFGGS